MAKECFTEKLRLNADNRQKLVVVNDIIEEFRR